MMSCDFHVFSYSRHTYRLSLPGSSQRVLPGVSFLRLHQQDGTSRPQSGVREVRRGTVEAGAGSGQFTFIYLFFLRAVSSYLFSY